MFDYCNPVLSFTLYAHLPAAVIALIAGAFMISQSTHLKIRIFFYLAISFLIFTLADLFVSMGSLGKSVLMTAYYVSILSNILILLLSSYFLYVLVRRKDAPMSFKMGWLAPVAVLGAVVFLGGELVAYDPNTCTVISSWIFDTALMAVDFLYLAFAIIFCVYEMMRNKEARREIAATSGGVIPFMGIFFLAENLAPEKFFIYALFALPLLLSLMAYLAAKFKVMRIRLATVQVLIAGVFVLMFAQFFFVNGRIPAVLNGILILFMVLISGIVMRNVNTEIKEREEIECLAASLTESNHNLHLANERLKDIDKQKDEFVSLATHQLRGPLAALKGYAAMILEGDYGQPPGAIRKTVELMARSIQSLIVVVGDYLDVSRIEQGEMKYDYSTFDLKGLVKVVIEEYRPVAETANLELNFEYSETEEFMVHADMGKIKQVIGNLIDNSIKYTPTGNISIKMKQEQGKKVLISISDTGVGIDKEVIPKLFTRFSRAPDASSVNILGTGLGLFVVRKIIEAHKGKIWVESEGLGKGSVFYIELWEV